MSKCALLFSAMLVLITLTAAIRPAYASAYDKGLEAYQADNYREALRRWKPLAQQGDARAAYNLGFMYEFGYGVSLNDATAFKYYLLAAQLGHAQAQQTVGWMYGQGKGVTPNPIQATKWARLSSSLAAAIHVDEIHKQKFVDQLVTEFKKAGARYDAQKALWQNPPEKLEASNQTS